MSKHYIKNQGSKLAVIILEERREYRKSGFALSSKKMFKATFFKAVFSK